MIPGSTLAFSGVQHAMLQQHLFPPDGLEAAAILICTRVPPTRKRLLVRDLILVPYEQCKRRARDALTWPGEYLEQAIDAVEPDGSIVIIHGHPGEPLDFSRADDESDRAVIPAILHAVGYEHGTAVMTANGAVRARLYDSDLRARTVELVTVAGDDLTFWWADRVDTTTGHAERPTAFTRRMTEELGRLTAAVIGGSGTGSIVAEQLARLGFHHVAMVDFDRVEHKNLNRILNATIADAEAERMKVDVFADACAAYRGDGVAIPVPFSIATREAVLRAAQCDVLFCCVDTLEARHIADRIGAAFLLPLFDVGVSIPVRRAWPTSAVADVCGRIDYVQPGGATLQDRRVYTPESLRAEYLRKVAPDAHRQEVHAGYIRGAAEEAPAVITLNMRAASACVNEFIARAYPYRLDSNRLYARTSFSLAACEEEYSTEGAFVAASNPLLGRGALEPLIGLPVLKAPTR